MGEKYFLILMWLMEIHTCSLARMLWKKNTDANRFLLMMLLDFSYRYRDSYLRYLASCIAIEIHVSTNGMVSGNKAAKFVLHNSFDAYSDHQSEKMFLKLHRQFSQAPFNHLNNLLKDAAMENQVNISPLEKVCNSGKLCIELKKTPACLVFGISQAHVFNKTVTMDLKEWTDGSSKTWFLHTIDHTTRYYTSSVIKS